MVKLGTAARKLPLLVAEYCFSRFVVITPIAEKSSAIVARCIQEKVFQAFGVPARVRTDNGTEFKGEFAGLCEALGVK